MGQPPTPPDTPPPEPSPATVEHAAEWLAHLESGDADAADLAAFDTWKTAHPSHAVAIDRLGGLGDQLRHGPPVSRETLRRLYLAPRRSLGSAAAIVALLGGTAWLLSGLPAVQLRFADQRTAVGESRIVPLADGSRLVLATDSAADIAVGADRRVVRLLRGEVFARVARRDAARFRVETTDGSAEALGTAFTVRKQDGATVVAVISSRVRACPGAADGPGCIALAPGERARLSAGAATRLSATHPDDIAAWADGWLPATDMSLPDLLDALNRWRTRPIRFDRPTLAPLRVSGVFPLSDTDKALANLARSQPITIDRSVPAAPVVRLRPQ
ncbi:FecR family protein [Sphingomonas flavalba]|uniref:FecR family protein n=1 Tax=Sphingomonas flavalba TaxID=2559804 RepID=UPI0039E1F8EA